LSAAEELVLARCVGDVVKAMLAQAFGESNPIQLQQASARHNSEDEVEARALVSSL